MTEQEAIERIKDHIKIHRLEEQRAIYLTDAFAIAISALEKQIHKEPINNLEYPSCPSCVNAFYWGCIDKYCTNCGQALKWEKN